MKTITIRELHGATGKWVRRSAALGEVRVSDRGHVIARLLPMTSMPDVPYFARRALTPAFRAAQARLKGGVDSSKSISAERDAPVA
jgi:antitoxin (DNA-binding transcriptional repressor) of toxin-antitoxin stability system